MKKKSQTGCTEGWTLEKFDGRLVIGGEVQPKLGPDEASEEEKRANHRLAAAAPTMLEALRRIVSQADSIENPAPDLIYAREAISKAVEAR